jgi:hypothetical protein
MSDLRDVALDVWRSFLNVPYRWAGDDPMEGVDCSGLVLEGLKAVGLVPRELDITADSLLRQTFKDYPRETIDRLLRRGMLVFWALPNQPVHHVEIVWATFHDRVLTLGASGGGSRTIDRATAVKQNAYVKIRRITPGWLCAVDPFPTLF